MSVRPNPSVRLHVHSSVRLHVHSSVRTTDYMFRSFIRTSVYMSVRPYVPIHARPSFVRLCSYELPFVRPSTCLYVRLYVCLHVRPSVCTHVYISVCPFVRLSVRSYVHFADITAFRWNAVINRDKILISLNCWHIIYNVIYLLYNRRLPVTKLIQLLQLYCKTIAVLWV